MRIGPELVIKTNKSQKKKSLPKRAGRRSPCHASTMTKMRERKAARRDAQAAAHARNVASGTSPWAQAKAQRAALRA